MLSCGTFAYDTDMIRTVAGHLPPQRPLNAYRSSHRFESKRQGHSIRARQACAENPVGRCSTPSFTLVLKAPYEDITVRDIVVRAGVRSDRSSTTALSAVRMRFLPPASAVRLQFSPMPSAARQHSGADGPARALLVEPHAGTGYFLRADAAADGRGAGAAHRTASARKKRRRDARRFFLPTRLAAIQLAEALFAPIAAWLAGQSACSAQQLALALRKAALALTEALGGGPTGPRQLARQGLAGHEVKPVAARSVDAVAGAAETGAAEDHAHLLGVPGRPANLRLTPVLRRHLRHLEYRPCAPPPTGA